MDYSKCAIPKPSSRKKQKKTNGWKEKKYRYCFYCGTNMAERHEVYAGANRQISIDNGFQVDLCRNCHEEIQHTTTERGIERDRALKCHFQKKYEKQLIDAGITPEQARELWIRLIGKSYL